MKELNQIESLSAVLVSEVMRYWDVYVLPSSAMWWYKTFYDNIPNLTSLGRSVNFIQSQKAKNEAEIGICCAYFLCLKSEFGPSLPDQYSYTILIFQYLLLVTWRNDRFKWRRFDRCIEKSGRGVNRADQITGTEAISASDGTVFERKQFKRQCLGIGKDEALNTWTASHWSSHVMQFFYRMIWFN